MHSTDDSSADVVSQEAIEAGKIKEQPLKENQRRMGICYLNNRSDQSHSLLRSGNFSLTRHFLNKNLIKNC